MQDTLNLITDWYFWDKRYHLTHPWYVNGYTYSTNSFCLLRVKGNYGENKNIDKFPKVEGIYDFDSMKGDGICLDVEAIEEKQQDYECLSCDSSAIRNPEICKECNGYGFVEFKNSYRTYHCRCERCDGRGLDGSDFWMPKDCPECHGTKIGLRAVWPIGNAEYSLSTLMLLQKKLNNLKFYPNASVKGMIGFRFDNGEGVLMRTEKP